VREVGGGFIDRHDGEALGGIAAPQTGDLREDEPYPMALFLAAPKFVANGVVNTLLRFDEALQGKRV